MHIRVVAAADTLAPSLRVTVGGVGLAVVAVDTLAVDVALGDEDGMAALYELVEFYLPVAHLGPTALDNLERIDRRLPRQRAGSPCGGTLVGGGRRCGRGRLRWVVGPLALSQSAVSHCILIETKLD